MSHRPTAAFALAASLAGCAATGGPQQGEPRADTGIAVAWQAPLPLSTAPTRMDGWWAAFQDPALVTLIDTAQAASPTLASAAARIEQARAASVAAGAGLMPRVDAAAGVSRGRSDLTASVATVGTAGVQAAWEIDLFGAGRATREAAQSRLAGTGFALQAGRLALAAETGTQYTALRACEAQVQQAEIDAASRQETARVTDDGARVGFIAPATAALARASAAQARSQLTVQRAACDAQIKTLVALTALQEPALRALLQAGRARVPQAAAITPQGLPASLLTRRADLQEAARQVEAAAADERAAQASRLPRVSLSGSIGAASVRSGGTSLDGTTWSLGPLQISVPLFDAGTRAAQAQAARAVYDEAVAAHRGRVREAVREVETALVALQATADREADARLATEGFVASFRATEARFKGGLASVFELEDARRTAVAAQSALIELQRERTTAWINLYRALGGGPDGADPALPVAAAR